MGDEGQKTRGMGGKCCEAIKLAMIIVITTRERTDAFSCCVGG